MDKVYYTIFFIALPIMCLMSYLVMATIWFFGKRKQEAKRILITGVFGGGVGYLIALIYFYLTRGVDFLSLIELSFVGFLMGGGYSMILFGFLPKNLRLGESKELESGSN